MRLVVVHMANVTDGSTEGWWSLVMGDEREGKVKNGSED